MRFQIVVVVIFLLLARCTSLTSAALIDDIRLPNDSVVSWVASDINQNGVPLKIQKFGSSQNIEAVLQFFRDEWSSYQGNEVPGYVENTIGEWSVISKFEWDVNLVVQLKPGELQSTEGFISTLDLRQAPIKNTYASDIPIPEGSTAMSNTQSDGIERTAITSIYVTDKSVSDVYSYFRKTMKRSGWTLSLASDKHDAGVLLFSKRDMYSEISVSSDSNGTTIFIINRVGPKE